MQRGQPATEGDFKDRAMAVLASPRCPVQVPIFGLR
jgi:hypothetical protein